MENQLRKPSKSKVTLAVSIVVLGTGVGAYAYWSGSGYGSGTAPVSSVVSVVKVDQLSTVKGLGPGVAPIALNGTFLNQGTAIAHVETLIVAIDTVTGGSGAGCVADDFTITGSPLSVKADLPVSVTGTTAWNGPTIAFKDNSLADQSGCIGATVNFKYSTT